jgi:hypothetical protein
MQASRAISQGIAGDNDDWNIRLRAIQFSLHVNP